MTLEQYPPADFYKKHHIRKIEPKLTAGINQSRRKSCCYCKIEFKEGDNIEILEHSSCHKSCWIKEMDRLDYEEASMNFKKTDSKDCSKKLNDS